MLKTLRLLKALSSQDILTRREENVLMEYSSGQIIQNMKESGLTIKQMARGSFGVQMETHMKVNGKMIKRTALVLSSQMMVKKDTLEIGKTISTMAKA